MRRAAPTHIGPRPGRTRTLVTAGTALRAGTGPETRRRLELPQLRRRRKPAAYCKQHGLAEAGSTARASRIRLPVSLPSIRTAAIAASSAGAVDSPRQLRPNEIGGGAAQPPLCPPPAARCGRPPPP